MFELVGMMGSEWQARVINCETMQLEGGGWRMRQTSLSYSLPPSTIWRLPQLLGGHFLRLSFFGLLRLSAERSGW